MTTAVDRSRVLVVDDEPRFSVAMSAISDGVRGCALDANNAEALWKEREEMVGEGF